MWISRNVPTFLLFDNSNANFIMVIYGPCYFEPSCPNGRRIHGLCNVFFSEEFVPKEPCCLVIRNAIKSSFARWQNSFIVFPWSKAWLGFFTRCNCAAPKESRTEKFVSLYWYWKLIWIVREMVLYTKKSRTYYLEEGYRDLIKLKVVVYSHANQCCVRIIYCLNHRFG